MPDPRSLLEPLLDLHARVRDEVVAATERHSVESLAAMDRDEASDTIYAIDVIGEQVIARFVDTLAREHSFVLVAEGTPEGMPYGDYKTAEWVIIVDPIDGTRGLMYQKRSAWILTGVATNRGPDTSLNDIVLAVQTEIPLVKQYLSDQLWAVRGDGVEARRFNRLTRESSPVRLRPSSVATIEHGYASISRFFPGGRDTLAAIDEEVVAGALGPAVSGKARCFEDQYASTGGQLYELLSGHDRFAADLRPLVTLMLAARSMERRGTIDRPLPLTCHPYDICTALIAEESGVIVTDPFGRPLDVALDTTSPVAWCGYANQGIRAQVEPLLQRALHKRSFHPAERDRELEAFARKLHDDNLFERGSRVFVSRAPGRLDVMGGIADYSGSLVLELPIAEATFAAVQRIDRPVLEIVSVGREPCTIPLDALAREGVPVTYEEARQLFAEDRTAEPPVWPHWASYVAGVLLVLARERGWPLTSGARIVVASNVPEGKGVSSSAAIETATMRALAEAFEIELEPRDLALLCQMSENLVTGAPCGVMDQMTCVFGEADRLLALLCQPAELQPSIPVPDDIAFWGLDSGERHAVGGSDYGAVRTGAFMGLRMVTERLGISVDYLANIEAATFEREIAPWLPEETSGEEFLARYGSTADAVTRVEAHRRYRVRAPTAHPIYERQRAERFRELLLAASAEERPARLGALMYESHASYGACGLGSPGTDRLVELVRAEGPAGGLYGARITGGGSGGTVAVIGRKDASVGIRRVAEAFERATGHVPYVFAGSSHGVRTFGAPSITL